MQVIALVDFHDNAKDVDRKRGEQFVVSQERFEEINSVAPNFGLDAIVGAVEKQSPESRAAKSRAKVRKA